MHGRSSLMKPLVWLIPFLCVKKREKMMREDEREKKTEGERENERKNEERQREMIFFFENF